MSEDTGTDRVASDEIEDPAGEEDIGPVEQVVGDDESGYGGAGQSDSGDADEMRPGSGVNRPPSDEDENQAV